jgi:hypothetical protein
MPIWVGTCEACGRTNVVVGNGLPPIKIRLEDGRRISAMCKGCWVESVKARAPEIQALLRRDGLDVELEGNRFVFRGLDH